MGGNLERFILTWTKRDELGTHEERYPDRVTCEDRLRAIRKDYGNVYFRIIDTCGSQFWRW